MRLSGPKKQSHKQKIAAIFKQSTTTIGFVRPTEMCFGLDSLPFIDFNPALILREAGWSVPIVRAYERH